ncbi:MAG: SusC/RagA family TonB-linked outer membrane protein [Cyclobacteriaceae bacterium]|nr:SusC/RagA family TonB-linked outer membrane protein [Cyclobacteriaceae bacterium]
MLKSLQSMLMLCLLFFATGAMAQTVTGQVTAASDGMALPGVSVIIKGTSSGTATDANGRYSINVSGPSTVLVYSYIGFQVAEVTVGSQSVINVSLVEDATELTEVVVTALGMERDTRVLQYSVTQVDGDNFTQARENNLANALAGRVAGVNVSNVASGPAGSSRVIIRGNKFLQGNNQPLYVVDGIPMDNSNFGQAGVWGGSDQGDGMTSINPDDIESISVLKGASAAALYGARAANGVINITTKKGARRKGIGVEFNSNFVFEEAMDFTDWQTSHGTGVMVGPTVASRVAEVPQNTQQAYDRTLSAWGPRFNGSPVIQFDGVSRPYSYAGSNWNRFFQTGTALTNTLALTGGSETQNFRFSISDLRSQAVIPNSGFDRVNVSFSTNSRFGQKLTFTSKFLYSNENALNRPRLSDSPGNAVQALMRLPGNINVNDLRGDPNKLGAIPENTDPSLLQIWGKIPGEEFQQGNNNWNQNPWWVAHQFINTDKRDRLIASGALRYNVNDWLYIQGRAGMDWFTRRRTELTPQGTGYNRLGTIVESEDRVREINLEWTMGANRDFGKFGINAFVGGNKMHRSNELIAARGDGFSVPFFQAINNAQQRNFNYGFSEWGINSLFGSAEFSYSNFLYLTATARNDWFSVLNPEFNSILYPSIGSSFVFSDAINILPSWLTFGKLRASWAQVGNVAINPYQVLLTYRLNDNPHLGRPMATFATAGGRSGTIPNANLQPPTSTETEIGVDLRFLQNRIGLDVTYYSQKTTDDILNATISNASGFGSTLVNIGQIQNRGVEFLLTATPIQKTFSWDVALNFARNRNEIVSLIDGQNELIIEEPRTRTVFIKHIVGQPFGAITGITQMRSPDGQLVYDALTGAPITNNQYEILGNGVPDFTGGLTNTFSYKGFNLDVLLDFRSGADIYSGTNVRMTQWGFHQQSLIGREGEAPLRRSGVSISGTDESGNPIFVPFEKDYTPGEAQNYWSLLGERAQENFMYDASFIQLRQLTFGYSFPQKMLIKTPFNTLMLSFVGRNLAVLFKNTENIHPESGYSSGNGQGLDYFGMPFVRSYGFNLRMTF